MAPLPAATPTTPATAASPNPAQPSAKDGESQLAKELAAKNTDGRAVELSVGGRTVQALWLPQSAPKGRGALLLLHDFGAHADWPGVVAPLRRALPPQGWSTLSVQLPLPGTGVPAAQREAWLDQAAPRIDAALEFLKGEGQANVVLVGHGLGAVAALDWLTAHPEQARGAVLISLPHLRGAGPRLATGELLGKATFPVLDLYGGADLDEVTTTASLRRTGAGHGGNYLQLALPGADHFFTAQGALLSSRIRGWLDRHTGGREGADDKNQPTDNQGTPP
jgi:pimeloyl-ACP methyl ester carboxylesterase